MFKYLISFMFLVGLVGCGDRIVEYNEVLVPAPVTQMVQLCAEDTGEFLEYGIFINESLYAILHQELSDGTSNTFLTELKTGTYKTTNGSDCIFIVE